MPLTAGSCFSGIGGFDLGLEWAGIDVRWFCECDPYAQKVLRKNWPDVPIHPDIRELKGTEVDPVDIVVGGFPCQDISYAGKGAGLSGERSGLFYEQARVIREVRPRYVLVENVAALRGRGLDSVVLNLAMGGYDVFWDTISAASVGAKHRRDRIFIIAVRHDIPDTDGVGHIHGHPGILSAEGRKPSFCDPCAGREDPSLSLSDSAGERREYRPSGEPFLYHQMPQRTSGRSGAGDVQDADGQDRPERSAEKGRGTHPLRRDQARLRSGHPDIHGDRGPHDRDLFHGPFVRPPEYRRDWETEPDVGRVAHGVPSRLDRLRCLGNAVVPQVGEHIGRLVIEYDRRRCTG